MKKAFRGVVAIVLIALVTAAWFFGSADVVRFSRANGITFIHCDEPADMRGPACARKFCETTLRTTNAIPQGHRVISTGALEDAAEGRIRVDGYISSSNGVSVPKKLFRCFVMEGKVEKIDVVS